ncbi:hypothetical protein, partial [Streptomyces sp. NPDC056049]|uniref:hypothetical protein n=1 Tax=Streptomyces sp. NPDC056049 TaxID=3345693 RepID=UPI0035D5416D
APAARTHETGPGALPSPAASPRRPDGGGAGHRIPNEQRNDDERLGRMNTDIREHDTTRAERIVHVRAALLAGEEEEAPDLHIFRGLD